MVRSGSHILVRAMLREGRSENALWSDHFDRNLGDAIALENDIASAVARAIGAELAPDRRHKALAHGPVDPEAIDDYLRGRYEMDQHDIPSAIQYFRLAQRVDSTWAPPYAGLADCYIAGWFYGDLPLAVASQAARSAADRALQLDSTLAEAQLARAYVVGGLDWNWSAAEAATRRALELSPGSADAIYRSGLVAAVMGRTDEFVADMKRAHDLDPLSTFFSEQLGGALYNARRYSEAIEELRSTLALAPQSIEAHRFLGLSLLEQGDATEAAKELRLVSPDANLNPELGYAYARAGDRVAALAIARNLQRHGGDRRAPLCEIALIYAALGDKDQAFVWLYRAYTAHDAGMMWLKLNPRLDPLRKDPRFTTLVQRMQLPA